METFEIYTIGSGYYLEKIFNAIRLILHPDNNFTSVMKLSALAAIVVITITAGLNSDFKTAAKWFFGVTILVGLFLTSKANVQIIDTLPDNYGRLSAPRRVESVPWGLALIGSVTSNIGNNIAQKFDQSLAGVFNNPDYQKTGILFGSKIVEDTSKMHIDDPALKQLMHKFYKKCIVPDLNMGYKRVNGYSLKDLTESGNILEFLKDRSSKARVITAGGLIKNANAEEYVSCQKAAEYLYTSLDQNITTKMPILAQKFSAFFGFNGPAQSELSASEMFKAVLESSYGIFLRNSSKEAKDILLQNIAINSLGEAADAKLYGKVATESMTKLAYNSVGQMAQKFIPILRAVLECLFYGVFPLVLILMVTPIGLDVLKNYAFGFIYLQLWQPMYAILFCIASSWGKLYASNITDITFATHSQIAMINEEISSVSGYMLTLVPVLSLFITKGLVANMGNLASSIIYIPQSTAVQNADAAIKGNYQIGTTSIDTHQSNTTTANKFDDNYSFMSGMKSFSMLSGAQEKMFSDGRSAIDSSGAISNLAGLAKIDWSKAIGNRYDHAINESISNSERQASNIVENTSSAHNKLLGFDQNYTKGSNAYEAWNSSLTSDQRKTIDEARSFVEKIAQENNINTQDALKIAVAANAGVGFNLFGTGGSLKLSTEGSRTYNDTEGYNKILQSSKDERFAESLAQIESFAYNSNYQQNSAINNNMIEGVRSDFNQAKQASFERSKSVDKTHSLQRTKADFENNTSAISQELSNKFAEENILLFGASGFENKIRNKPEETNILLNEFLNKNLNIKSDVSKDYNQQHDLTSDYQQNVQAITKNNLDNKAKIVEEAPTNFQNEVRNTLDIKTLKQNHVENQLNDTSTKIVLTSADQSSKEANLREKVEAKHK
jgi:conjugal transfer mating pair stabilization protein TraG